VETVALPVPSAEQREKLFFLSMAVAIAVTVVVAFGLFYAAGISSFDSPWWVHVHAVTFVGWIVLYVLQNTLVFRNDIAVHRKLGRIGAGYAAWMVLVGLVLTPLTLAVGRSPPFFTPPYFLALDWVNVALFGALVYAGIRNRHRTDWHRRLMLCATICVIAPALGRLIVLSGAAMTAPVNAAFLLLYVVTAMLFDWRNRGRVHPAYAWGAGALVLFAVATELLAILPIFAGAAARIAG
jgi:FtsH-binding integral membrane protein